MKPFNKFEIQTILAHITLLLTILLLALTIKPASAGHEYILLHHIDQGKEQQSFDKCMPIESWNGHEDHEGDWYEGPYDNKDCLEFTPTKKPTNEPTQTSTNKPPATPTPEPTDDPTQEPTPTNPGPTATPPVNPTPTNPSPTEPPLVPTHLPTTTAVPKKCQLIPICQEDAVLIGMGNFENGYWDYYICGPSLDNFTKPRPNNGGGISLML